MKILTFSTIFSGSVNQKITPLNRNDLQKSDIAWSGPDPEDHGPAAADQ